MPYSLDRRSTTLDFWINRMKGLDYELYITHFRYIANMYDNYWERRPEYTNIHITKEMLTDTYKNYVCSYIRRRNCKGCFACDPKLSEEMLKEDEENEKWNAVNIIKEEEEEEEEEEMYECPKCEGEENIPLCKTHNICSSCWFKAIDILIRYRQNKKINLK